jgi:hypothetical protein
MCVCVATLNMCGLQQFLPRCILYQEACLNRALLIQAIQNFAKESSGRRSLARLTKRLEDTVKVYKLKLSLCLTNEAVSR